VYVAKIFSARKNSKKNACGNFEPSNPIRIYNHFADFVSRNSSLCQKIPLRISPVSNGDFYPPVRNSEISCTFAPAFLPNAT
jgi:hypothetical protein